MSERRPIYLVVGNPNFNATLMYTCPTRPIKYIHSHMHMPDDYNRHKFQSKRIQA